ncbi:MAG TPA: MotA/TolQ/ExbB proton channel family protein [Ignavibacteriales bacterium]|nr:MotA/TolQ/ExbB proton channel family protein [Ignavibacteriales bacterium]HOL81298.1 MotA/TolQ/ExbB proton channel family protein [Ignavibacteriales bacterium]HOM66046.1 MotA/TolQ/ExbB proton channel family protein [Ignavibacteriales bacterium]HPD67538.1 MotA/TolQ/ExbB proton channel family protein [Ignavibacteriales bacterium]HPP33408.1 MotA/TolQ/ExbB proton channel family protein [Ignavibacteriales bacterium]
MFIIIGSVLVFLGIIVGMIMGNGNPLNLIVPSEFVVLGGASIGSLIIMTNGMDEFKKVINTILGTLKAQHSSKSDFLELLKAFNDLFLIAQRDGLIAIEKHIEAPEQSEILSRNKKFISNEFYRSFFCDTMRVMLSGGVPPHEIEALMDSEIETFENERKPIIGYIQTLADAFPGLGIVAAVLGVINTMGIIDRGAAEVGMSVAHALTGTFLGVLMSYGIIGPIGKVAEHQMEHEVRYLETIKACLVAYAKGNPPIIAVEIARRTISSDHRPSFSELENYIRGK